MKLHELQRELEEKRVKVEKVDVCSLVPAHLCEGVDRHGAYHMVTMYDDELEMVVRRRMYTDGHLGAVEY